MNEVITISGLNINGRDNLYSLVDIHKASGSDKEKTPENWVKLPSTISLIKTAEEKFKKGLH